MKITKILQAIVDAIGTPDVTADETFVLFNTYTAMVEAAILCGGETEMVVKAFHKNVPFNLLPVIK